MPYRIDLPAADDRALDCLVELGAIDVEQSSDGVAALIPDSVSLERVALALGVAHIAASPAIGRDAGSVWVLSPRPVEIGRLRIFPAHMAHRPGTLRLIDAPAFGTGLHPTTAMCLEALDAALGPRPFPDMLDVGTGSGVLALAALTLGVPRATAIDIDEQALRIAAENARLNGLEDRVQLMRGGPETLSGTWPLVFANVLAASLIDMAPALVRLVGHEGQVVLSGIPVGLEHEVAHTYGGLGMRRLGVKSQAGWTRLVLQAAW